MKKNLIIFSLIISIFHLSYSGDDSLERCFINNFKCILKQTKGPGIISGAIYILGGSVEDPVGKRGLTNLTLKVLLKGSKNLDSYQINRFFEDSGGFISVSTSEEYSTIEFSVKTEDFKNAIGIINDILNNPSFEQEKLNIEKQNTKAQLKSNKESGISYGIEKLREIAFDDTPYEVSPLGKEQEIDNITVEDLKSRWKQLYDTKRFIFSIVGDMEISSIKEALSGVIIDNTTDYEPKKLNISIKATQCQNFKREGSQSTILVMYNAPQVDQSDYPKFKVLNSILGDGFTSKLFQELREKKGYAYAVGSFYSPRPGFGYMVLYIGTSPEKTEYALNDMKEIISNFPNMITEEDLKTAKEKLIGSFLMNHQTRLKQASYLGLFEAIGLGYEYDSKFKDLINDVKLQDIVELYNRYLPKESACVIVRP